MSLKGYDSLCQEYARIITTKDKGNSKTVHIANNVRRSRVAKYHIDGVVIREGARCDYLLLNEDYCNAYLIELKGSALAKAAEQLHETAKKLSSELASYHVYYRIVANRCATQKINTTGFRKYQILWKESLKYTSIRMEEDI